MVTAYYTRLAENLQDGGPSFSKVYNFARRFLTDFRGEYRLSRAFLSAEAPPAAVAGGAFAVSFCGICY